LLLQQLLAYTRFSFLILIARFATLEV